MDERSNDDRKRKRFLWGIILSGTLFLPLFGMLYIFRGISEQKATGLGAVAAGVTDVYVTFGLILAFVLPVAAILLLIRSFSGAHWARSLFSAVCIFCNAVILVFVGLSMWLYFVIVPHSGDLPSKVTQ